MTMCGRKKCMSWGKLASTRPPKSGCFDSQNTKMRSQEQKNEPCQVQEGKKKAESNTPHQTTEHVTVPKEQANPNGPHVHSKAPNRRRGRSVAKPSPDVRTPHPGRNARHSGTARARYHPEPNRDHPVTRMPLHSPRRSRFRMRSAACKPPQLQTGTTMRPT